VITDVELVAASAATYAGGEATFSGLSGTVRCFRTLVDGVAIYAIEGTHDKLGWALDFMALPIPMHVTAEHPDIGWVHAGINAALDSIWPLFVETIAQDEKYAITGHSLGAGLAVIATARLVALKRPPLRWAAFAPPRVGFKKMIDLVTSVPGTGYRNGNDPVTDVPFRAEPMWIYEQVPLLRGGETAHPPWDAHHIDNYAKLVETLYVDSAPRPVSEKETS
jgi:hypothetical protein